MDRLERLCEWLLRRRYPALLVGAGLVLALPSLWVGVQSDDVLIRAAVLRLHREGYARSPWEAFVFLSGEPAENLRLRGRGWVPFWIDLRMRAAFFRPLTVLTHMLDYRAWDALPWLMHVHSLAWLALLIWAAAALYRRLMGRTLPAWVAVLAALLFALDDAHAVPAGWLANRGALIAGVFGILALLAHDRWRHDGWRPGAFLGPLALLAGLLAKEEAISTCAYLFAYALFVDRARPRRRLLSLVPCLLVAVAWYAAYRAAGFGAAHSGMYVDPSRAPLRFLGQAARNAPLLLLGQWGLPDSDISNCWSAAALLVHWFWALAFLGLMAVLLAPLLRRDRLARFWAFGMVLSVVPVCAPFPSDRLLIFVGLGASPLLAQFLGGLAARADWLPAWRAWRRLARGGAVALIAVNLIVNPLLVPPKSLSFRLIGSTLTGHFATLPRDDALRGQTVVYVASMMSLVDYVWQLPRSEQGLPVPRRTLQLNASASAATVTRRDKFTLVVRPRQGYLCPVRGVPGEEHREPVLSAHPIHRLFDLLLRAPGNLMERGEAVGLPDATVTITDLTPDGRPAEATFTFTRPLEDPSYRWLRLTKEGFVPFTPPPVGQAVEVPPPL